MKHKGYKKAIVRILGPGKAQYLRISLFCIFISLVAGSVLLLLLGKNPLEGYVSILQGAGFIPKARYAGHKSIFTDFMSLVNYTTPMIFASLSFAVAMRCGIFNINISGMMLFSGFIASITVGYSSIPAPFAQILVVLIAVVAGAFSGALIGWLKHRFNANEVVISIMFNYIVSYVISFFIQTMFINPTTRQSERVGDNAMLTGVDTMIGDLRMDVSYVFPLAIIAVILIGFMFSKTRIGFELKAVGMNHSASRYAGIRIGWSVIFSMALSGVLAGLAGVSYYLGTFASIQPRVVPSLGFDAIAVALLGNNNPLGCLLASFLVMTISNGTTYMSSRLGVLREIASLITGILLLFSACGGAFKALADKYKEELDNEIDGGESK